MNNLFESYDIYTRETEPPTNYHVWTLISCISACLGRKCFIPQGTYTVYPNLYIVLVGAPGMKKSSAMNIGKNFLRTIPDFPLSPASMTREAMLQSLELNRREFSMNGVPSEFHQIACFVTEFQEFLGGKHRNSSMIDILTAIWDEPTYEYNTKNSKPIKIDAPYVSLLACCTTEWLNEKLDASIISDGLARRIIFVYEEHRSKFVPFPKLTEKQLAEFSNIKDELTRLIKTTGRFEFTDDAMEYWEKRYVEIQTDAETRPEFLQHYFTTKHVLMLKVSMCLSAVLRKDMRIDRAMLCIVDRMFDAFEDNLPNLFRNVGRNKLKPYMEKLVDFIEAEGGKAIKADIMKFMFNDMDTLEVIQTLDGLVQANILTFDATTNVYSVVTQTKKARTVNLFELIKSYHPSTPEGKPVIPSKEDVDRVTTPEKKIIIEENKRRVKDFDEEGFITLT